MNREETNLVSSRDNENYYLRRAIEAKVVLVSPGLLRCTDDWDSHTTTMVMSSSDVSRLTEVLMNGSLDEEAREEIRDGAYDAGQNDGYGEGHADGKEEGYKEGKAEGYQELKDLIEELLLAKRNNELDECLVDAANFHGVFVPGAM